MIKRGDLKSEYVEGEGVLQSRIISSLSIFLYLRIGKFTTSSVINLINHLKLYKFAYRMYLCAYIISQDIEKEIIKNQTNLFTGLFMFMVPTLWKLAVVMCPFFYIHLGITKDGSGKFLSYSKLEI